MTKAKHLDTIFDKYVNQVLTYFVLVFWLSAAFPVAMVLAAIDMPKSFRT